MRIWGKLLAAAVAPLMLTSCLWGPGKFTSNLALNKSGTFVLDYRGEIMLQLPDDNDEASPAWDPKQARCYADGRAESGAFPVPIIATPPAGSEPPKPPATRPCSAAELKKMKAEHEQQEAERREAKRKKTDEMAQMFGLPGADDAANRAFAAKLTKYAGWRSVTYKGKGVFDVDYHFEGRLTQDFLFPMMPDNELIIPFIALRRRTDGSVSMTAPALGGNPFAARAKAMGLPDKGDQPPSHAEGRFTVITDGEILTNNSEDGPTPHPAGRQVHWDVSPGSIKTPEMLVRL
jgi:hypothetical protein